MLVSGYLTPSDQLRFGAPYPGPFVFTGKRYKTARRVKNARLYPFTKHGGAVALRHAEALLKEVSPESISFLMRVVVTGPPEKPEEVIEAWQLEGAKAVWVRYYFD